jgi:hypothetical protein
MGIQYYRVYPSSHGRGIGMPPVLPAGSSTKPARFARVGMIGGSIAPPRPIAPGLNPPQSTGGQPTRPNRCKPPPIAPSKRAKPSKPGGQPIGPTNPARSIPGQSTLRPNNRPIAGGQSTRKRAKRSTRANPQQNPNNPAKLVLK